MSRAAKVEVPAVMSVAERQAKLRSQRLADGWVCLNSLWLEPEAAAKLAALVDQGETATQVVNRLLKRARAPS